VSPVIRVRSPRFGREFLAAWVAIVGLMAGLVALVPVQLSWWRSALALGSSILMAGSYAWLRSKPVHLAIEEFVPDPESCRFTIQCPCKRELAIQANRIAAGAYGPQPPIAAERYEQWRLKNTSILACVLDSSKCVVGYFDVLPLRKDFFELLRAGSVSEQDIRYEHILEAKQSRSGTRLYLAGIAVEAPETIRGKRTAAILVWALLKYLDHYYSNTPPHPMLAVGATSEGERLLKHFGFSLAMPGEHRREKKPLYECTLDRAFLSEAMRRVPAWDHTVCLSWQVDGSGA